MHITSIETHEILGTENQRSQLRNLVLSSKHCPLLPSSGIKQIFCLTQGSSVYFREKRGKIVCVCVCEREKSAIMGGKTGVANSFFSQDSCHHLLYSFFSSFPVHEYRGAAE